MIDTIQGALLLETELASQLETQLERKSEGRSETGRANRWAVRALALLAGVLLSAVSAADDTDLFAAAVAPNVMLLVDNSGSMNNLVWHDAFDPTVDPACVADFGFPINNESTYAFSNTFTTTQCGNTRTLYADDTITGSTRILGRYLNWYFDDVSDPYFKGTGNNDDDNMDSLANGTRSQCLVDTGLPATYSRFRRSRITAAQEVLSEVVCQVNEAGSVRFGLAQFYDDSDPEGGYVAVQIDDYTTGHADDIADFIDDLAAETWTPLGEALFNIYRYFQSRSNPISGVTGDFDAYNLNLDGNSASGSSVPPTPVIAECQKNFLVVITDGAPTKDDFDSMSEFFTLIGDYNSDNTTPEAGSEEVGDSSETAYYMDDVAMFMQENDFQEDFDGDQVIDVYTVGFTTAGAANDILSKAAAVGNGFFRQSNNADELANVIIEAIVDIVEKSQSFTSATVPASRTTDGDNFYATYFRPRANSPFWEGHVKNFKFTSSGDILTGDDKCAVGDGTEDPPCSNNGSLSIASNGVSEWGPQGDAGTRVPLPGSRTLRVGKGGPASADFGDVAPAFTAMTPADFGLDTAGTGALTDPPYNLPASPSAGELAAAALDLQDNLAGCEFGTHLGSDCVTRTSDGVVSLLGDIFHSNPVVVGSPNQRINSLSYKQFASTFRDRDRVIYAGANDGFLRGFHAGEYKTEDPPGTPLIPPRHDRGTGVEVFGFMPASVRQDIWDLPLSQPTGTIRQKTTVDGSSAVADVWFYRNGGLGTLLNPPVSSAPSMAQWRTVLIGGLRGGGRYLYALDVTDPDGAVYNNYPGYLWDFPCVDCTGAVNEETGTGADSIAGHMGYTWSEPVITRVRVDVTGQGPQDRWVAVVGAGYDVCGDPNGLGYFDQGSGELCDAGDPVKANRGRGIFIIDITTGKVLGQKVFKSASATPGPSVNKGERSDLVYAFASAPAVFDINFDGYGDVIYIGDLGGRMWRWTINAVGEDPVNDGTKHVGQANWPFGMLFRADHSDAPGAGTDASHFQSFFFPPTAVKDGSGLILAWGAGERADPLALQDDSEALDNNNHYYLVEDDDPYFRNTLVTLTEANLFDVTALEVSQGRSLLCSDLGTEKGYFITGFDGEKFITKSIVFLGDIITGSFRPPSASASLCDSSGTAVRYQFRLKCAVGVFPGTPREKRFKTIGKGVPTDPRVSVGGLQQKSSDPCENRAVVVTSDGGVDNDCISELTDKVVELRSWRER